MAASGDDGRYIGWGRYPRHAQQAVDMPREAGALPVHATQAGLLAFGNGRSYGDSCLNGDGGTLLDTRRLNRIVSFDSSSGVIEAEAGVLLGDILRHVLPQGWFLPVTPGTKWVTLGGAIANDVHGKNHHARGTFGGHVASFRLLRSSGEHLDLAADRGDALFRATIGGLGLTGLITSARVRLIRVESAAIDQDVIRFGGLAEFFDLARDSDRRFEYSVAWIDQGARGRAMGRGLFIRGNHAAGDRDKIAAPAYRARLAVPFQPPLALINRPSLALFNFAYWRQQAMGLKRTRVDHDPFFYPLDKVRDWNRLYGPGGLLQHQSVVPMADGARVVGELLAASQRASFASFLTVLKVFGDAPSPGLLSFPRPGVTLTLDFANTGPRVLSLLDDLDRIVMAAGGAINPYKDARMAPATFALSFPRLGEFMPHIDPAFSSSFWRRVNPRG
jgi:FAD/FMN-containing dehydrogenase